MKQQPYIENLKARLVSTDLETHVRALEEAAKVVEDIAKVVVQSLRNSSSPPITAEKIARLGSVVIPALEDFVVSSEKGEKRTQAAILLLFLGSRKGLSDVLEAVENGSDDQFLAANKLANAGVREAGELIIKRLRTLAATELFDRQQAPKFVALWSALEKLKIDLPVDLQKQFTSPDVPREISELGFIQSGGITDRLS